VDEPKTKKATLILDVAYIHRLRVEDKSAHERARRSSLFRRRLAKASSPSTGFARPIHAPVEKVWLLLTDVTNWPKWQPDISVTKMAGPDA
jgi:hypothetical protein